VKEFSLQLYLRPIRFFISLIGFICGCKGGVTRVVQIRACYRKKTIFSKKETQFWCPVDRASRYICVLNINLMHYLSSVYFVSHPLHVSGISVAHHQEVYCIYTAVGTCCAFWLTFCWPGQQTLNQKAHICCHNTDHVHVNGHNRTILVILAKYCTRLPDDGSSVIRNTLEHF